MQLLSLAGVGVEAQRLFEELSYNSGHDYRTAAVVFLAITFALWVLAAWIGARAVMKDNPGAGTAVVTGFQWMSGFLLAIVLSGTAFYFARLRGQATMASASLAIGGVLCLYTALSVPMNVHRLSIFQAAAFALIGLIVHFAGQLFVQKTMGDPLDLQTRIEHVRHLAALPPEDASKVLTALRKPAAAPTPAPVAQATPPPKPIAEPTPAPPPKPAEKTIAERHDELKKTYADLMARHVALREDDDAAIEAYKRDTAHYIEHLAQLQKDSDAQKK